ncbi:glycosyltransferase family 4 protein [Patescibacteria group bacterium]
MKILFLHRWTGVRGGGTETHLKGLIRNLKDKHEITLVTRQGAKIRELREEYPNINIITISKNLFENDNSYENTVPLYLHTALFMTKLFFKLIWILSNEKYKPDVMSIHFATEAVVANKIRNIFKIPYVFIFEGYTDWEAQEGKKADESISITHYISKKCNEKFGYYPQVINIGEDKFPVVSELDINNKAKVTPKVILTLCRLEPRKNLKAFVETVRIIIKEKKRKDIKFILGGTGISQPEILELINKYGLNKAIEYKGFVPEQNLVETYQKAHVYFLPTYEEGFGIVYLEAMKSGCPIVSTNISATPEIVGNTGILVDDPDNYQDWSKAILDLVDKQDLWLKKAKNCIEKGDKFWWKDLITDYEKVYKKATKKN